jgi:hypothetical protein
MDTAVRGRSRKGRGRRVLPPAAWLPAAACGLLSAVPALAQDGGGTRVVVEQPTPYVEMLVVAAACAAAVFAVCRSSRRN